MMTVVIGVKKCDKKNWGEGFLLFKAHLIDDHRAKIEASFYKEHGFWSIMYRTPVLNNDKEL